MLRGEVGLIHFPVAFANVTQRGRVIAGDDEELIGAPWAVVILWVNSEALKKAKHGPGGPSRHSQIKISPAVKRGKYLRGKEWQAPSHRNDVNSPGKIMSVTYFTVI